MEHFQQFLLAEQSDNETFELEKRVKEVNAEMVELLNQKLDPSLRDVVERLFLTEQVCAQKIP